MDAGIVHKVSRIREPKMPLKFYEDIDAFKLFLLDCGLLACMTDAPADQMLIGNNAFTDRFIPLMERRAPARRASEV